MYPLKQNTAVTIPVFIHNANGDAVTGLSDGDFTKRISKGSGAFAAMTVTITEKENGWYDVPISTAHSDTVGILTVTLTHASAKQVNLQFRVSAKLLDDLNDVAATDIVSAGAITTLSGAVVNVDTVDVCTSNVDMRGTDNAALAAVCTEGRLAELDAGNIPSDLTAIAAAIAGLNDISVADVQTTQMTESYAANAVVPTQAQILFEIRSLLATMARSGVNVTAYKIDGTTPALTYVFDDAANPSSITRQT
jgi:hypothetical protein